MYIFIFCGILFIGLYLISPLVMWWWSCDFLPPPNLIYFLSAVYGTPNSSQEIKYWLSRSLHKFTMLRTSTKPRFPKCCFFFSSFLCDTLPDNVTLGKLLILNPQESFWFYRLNIPVLALRIHHVCVWAWQGSLQCCTLNGSEVAQISHAASPEAIK